MIRLFIALSIIGTILYFVIDASDSMKVKAQYDEWAEIQKVEENFTEFRRKASTRNIGKVFVNWKVTLGLKNGQSVKISVLKSPIPKPGGCIPVTVIEFSKGGVAAILDAEQWRYGQPKPPPCN